MKEVHVILTYIATRSLFNMDIVYNGAAKNNKCRC